jgi:hypothetical protein
VSPYFIQLFISILFEFIHLFICIFFEFSQMLIHVFFNSTGHSYHFFEFAFWDFTVIPVLYCEIVDFWRRCWLCFCAITCIPMLGFMHLWPGFRLEVLISWTLSVEVFTMFRQNSKCLVAELWCIFSSLDWGCGSMSHIHPQCSRHWVHPLVYSERRSEVVLYTGVVQLSGQRLQGWVLGLLVLSMAMPLKTVLQFIRCICG